MDEAIINLKEATDKEALNTTKTTSKNDKTDHFDFFPNNEGEEPLISFKAVEREHYEKSTAWFVLATIIAIASIIYFIMDQAFSSAIVFALILSILYLYGNEPPRVVEIHITSWGIYINKHFYDYKSLKCFWIINDPVNKIHALHLEAGKNILRILTIQLHDIQDNYIRTTLSPYIKEDLEREEPMHNQIRRIIGL